MAVIIHETDLDALETRPGLEGAFLRHQAYCALDCCTPIEIFDKLHPRLDEDTARIYRFQMACLRASLTMQLRGVLVAEGTRQYLVDHYEEIENEACAKVAELAADVFDRTIPRIGRCGEHRNHLWPRKSDIPPEQTVCCRCGVSRMRAAPISATSHAQVAHLFYDLWKVRVRRDRATHKPTTDKEALDSIRGEYVGSTKPWIAEAADWCLKAHRAQKQAGYARAIIDPDGRYRHTPNVAATETGRWSASKSPTWTGGNIQQLADELREMFIPDPGLVMGYADLEQAESHIVAKDSGDEAYIKVHQLSDPHTAVCKLVWPELPWPGGTDWQSVYICERTKHILQSDAVGNEQRDCACCDRGLAETCPVWDPYHSYRDYAKRIQHGGNMGRTPQGVARQIHVSVLVAAEVYARMYGGHHVPPINGIHFTHPGAFPRIKARHQQLKAELQRTGTTISCFGRKRQFLGRTWDEDTLREALGQLEQSPVADILNLSLLRAFDQLDLRANVHDAPHPDQPNKIWLLAQVHDAILFLVRPGDMETLRRLKDLMTIPFYIEGRLCTLGVEISVGTSWAKKDLKKVSL